MQEIISQEVTEDFAGLWRAAGNHLNARGQGSLNWIKADLVPPMLEHLSFRIGNQIFFVRVEDVGREVDGPSGRSGLMSIAKGCGGHACLMPMKREDNVWVPATSSWGLIDAATGDHFDPLAFVSDKKIEMTDWEVHDVAVTSVVQQLERQDEFRLLSSQGNPGVDPSFWFAGKEGPEWVVVRAVRYPERDAPRPSNLDLVIERNASVSKAGHFASVSVANSDDPFDPAGQNVLPIWRGYRMFVRFEGLEQVT